MLSYDYRATTVPSSFRRAIATPKVLRLHYGAVSEGERKVLFGLPVTNCSRIGSIRLPDNLDRWKEEFPVALPNDTPLHPKKFIPSSPAAPLTMEQHRPAGNADPLAAKLVL